MTTSHLLFTQDKNCILKEVQADKKTELLERLTLLVRHAYLTRFNPLDLEDDTIRAIKACKEFNIELLGSFYWELAGVFRYKAGSNQLEFIFSGRSHYDKYLDDWTEAFELWIEDFLCSSYFIRAILEMTIISPRSRAAWLAKDRLKVYLSQYFNLRVYKYRGIVPIQAA